MAKNRPMTKYRLMPLRHVRITYENGQVVETEVRGEDRDLQEYYRVGRRFNVGLGPEDNIQKVAKLEILPTRPKRQLECCCCGGDAGRWEQWYNRDTGYGICPRCVESARSHGESEEEIKSNYGVEGINYGKS